MRVVLRTFEDRLAANLQQGFDIYRAYSTSALAAPAFAAAATHAPVDYAFAYGEGDEPRALMTVTKFTVVPESVLVGWTIGRLEDELDVQVLAHRRETFRQHPPDDVVLEVGDGVVVSAGPGRPRQPRVPHPADPRDGSLPPGPLAPARHRAALSCVRLSGRSWRSAGSPSATTSSRPTYQPRAAKARTTASSLWIMPGSLRLRSVYGAASGGSTVEPFTYGFTNGFTSMARP